MVTSTIGDTTTSDNIAVSSPPQLNTHQLEHVNLSTNNNNPTNKETFEIEVSATASASNIITDGNTLDDMFSRDYENVLEVGGNVARQPSDDFTNDKTITNITSPIDNKTTNNIQHHYSADPEIIQRTTEAVPSNNEDSKIYKEKDEDKSIIVEEEVKSSSNRFDETMIQKPKGFCPMSPLTIQRRIIKSKPINKYTSTTNNDSSLSPIRQTIEFINCKIMAKGLYLTIDLGDRKSVV